MSLLGAFLYSDDDWETKLMDVRVAKQTAALWNAAGAKPAKCANDFLQPRMVTDSKAMQAMLLAWVGQGGRS